MNLIGEHTDYNEVFVLPLAIDRATWIVLRARNDTTVRLHSPEHKETSELTDADLKKGPTYWSKYPKGVTWALREDGYELRGWEGVSACAQIVSLAVKSTSNSPILSHAVSHGEENRREVIGRHPKCCEKTPREWTKQ